eukprot:5282120-Pleurochrysis_carterae.AAC.1
MISAIAPAAYTHATRGAALLQCVEAPSFERAKGLSRATVIKGISRCSQTDCTSAWLFTRTFPLSGTCEVSRSIACFAERLGEGSGCLTTRSWDPMDPATQCGGAYLKLLTASDSLSLESFQARAAASCLGSPFLEVKCGGRLEEGS